MKRILNIFFILLCFLGCKTDYTPLGHSPEISMSIVGKWEWIRSESSWTGEITTPVDVGYHETKVFEKDGTLRIFRNSALYAEYKYSVTYEDSTETKSTGIIQIIQDSHPTFVIDHNTLILSLAYVDGPISFYSRIK